MTVISSRTVSVAAPGSDMPVTIAISSADKPALTDECLARWQQLGDSAVTAVNMTAAVINQLDEDGFTPVVSAAASKNAFSAVTACSLGRGVYCEAVAAHGKEVYIPDARKMEPWKQKLVIDCDMVSYFGLPLYWSDGEMFGTFCLLDRVPCDFSAENRKLLALLGEILQADLHCLQLCDTLNRERSVLNLRYIEEHHRIMNQLNMLISLINITAARKSHNQELVSVLMDVSGSIRSMSVINSKMQAAAGQNMLDLKSYMLTLISGLLESFAGREVTFSCDADDITLPSDKIVPCGLILSELVTNSIKHAFDADQIDQPLITVAGHRVGTDKVTLFYKDNGRGVAADVDLMRSRSRGLRLIRALSDQLEGEMHIQNHEGLSFLLTFPV